MKLKIWDSPTRVFHWFLVCAIAFQWFSGETGNVMTWHMQTGTLLIALMLYRIVWGLIGSETARFDSFLSIRGAIRHAKSLPHKAQSENEAIHAGHNPLGGFVVILMIALILFQAITGLFISDDVLSEGPLYHLVDEDQAETLNALHETGFNVIVLLAGLHIAAIIFYKRFKRTNLLKAMLTGRADWPANKTKPSLTFKSGWLALLVFSGIYGSVYYSIHVIQ